MGSVGTRAWIVLMLGNDDSDPLFLQAKEAQASVPEPFLGKRRRRRLATQWSGQSEARQGSTERAATPSNVCGPRESHRVDRVLTLGL